MPAGDSAGQLLNRVFERHRIASARRECLDRLLITGERHLRLVLSEYVDAFFSGRPTCKQRSDLDFHVACMSVT